MADGYNPQGIWQPNGRAFSQGVIQGPGEVVHVTGQVAWDAQDQVAGLVAPELRVELVPIAVVPHDRFRRS